ncbi:MAG: DNA-3-methyladenine glycosylase I [Candidatus Moraniibacteriota bacterium]
MPAENALYERYHDTEWGIPVKRDRTFFEFLILESAQAGLSWETILKRRNGYRQAFADFNPVEVARFGKRDIDRLMKDPGIIRNRLKITSAISNAQIFIAIRKEYGTFSNYVWRFVDGQPIRSPRNRSRIISPEADALAADLKRRGFKFFGPVIAYAFLQATGLVDDHEPTCFLSRSST